ncbi:uncharacterized protein LOC130670540 [Microplitis mediator]|uniref:uncharacterized protein LOC130670540 n=1 Tax=Microplitis mediator TaxID=375433 RepID=UPI002553ED7F|nr:uncharacterized protein LOC130670540 [Microplitis mediator]
MSGSWSRTQVRWHSNKKEKPAVYQSLAQQGQSLRGAHILLQSDNRTVVAYIRKEGGTKSLELYNLTHKLLTLIDELQVSLSAYYLPGRYSGTADQLSRKKALPEWHLLPEATEEVFKRWGTPEIDLFGSAESAVIRTYVSLDCRDRSTPFTDCLQSNMGIQARLAFSTSQPDPKSTSSQTRARVSFY